MAFDKLKTEIAILLTEMQNEPHDRHEVALQIHEKLRELAAFGLPLPQDLVDLEAVLDAELEGERLRFSRS